MEMSGLASCPGQKKGLGGHQSWSQGLEEKENSCSSLESKHYNLQPVASSLSWLKVLFQAR